MASWPSSIPSLPTTLENFVDTVQASHVNIVNGEVTAVMSSLGTSFTGSFTTQNSLWANNHEMDGTHNTVNVGVSVVFSSDTNLYRRVANALRTDDALEIVGNLTVDAGGAGKVLYFGSSQDTDLYRQAANILQTNDNFHTKRAVNLDIDDAGYKLFFGSGQDTNLYRAQANVLKTDDGMVVTNTLSCGNFIHVSSAQRFTHGLTTKYASYGYSHITVPFSDYVEKVNLSNAARPKNIKRVENGYIGVNLPHGSVITTIDIYGSSGASDGYVFIELYRNNNSSGAGTSVASLYFNGASVSDNLSGLSIAIDNNSQNYSFIITLCASSSVNNALFYSALITYTSSNMLQTI